MINPTFKISLFLFTMFIAISMGNNFAYAQKTEYMNWSLRADERTESLINKALKTEIEQFRNEYGSTLPDIQYSLKDVNGDGKPEIFARFVEEYYMRDEKENVMTYGYAYTSRGLIKIFEAMAGDIAIGRVDQSGLKQIIAFRGMTVAYDVYKWDGQRRYTR